MFSQYYRLLPLNVGTKLLNLMRRIPRNMCEECFITTLKNISDTKLATMIACGYSDELYFLDMLVLTGYDTILNRVDPLTTIRSDFGQPKQSSQYDSKIKQNIDFFVNKMLIKEPPCTFAQFVSLRDHWTNSGSSTYGTTVKVNIKTGGTKSKSISIRNKWFKTLGHSDSELIKASLSSRSTEVRPFRKLDEAAKTRMVQGYDTLSILRVSYLEECFKSYNPEVPWTSCGFGPQQKLSMREELLKDDGLYRVCTDQKSFDINQSRDIVEYAIRRILFHIQQRVTQPDVHSVARAEIRSMDNVKLTGKDYEFQWKRGLLSGHKWTALLGSLINAAETKTVDDLLDLDQRFALFQGDDCVLKVASTPNSDLIADAYKSLELSVNPSKTWISTVRCEYLHELYDAKTKRVLAFPARIAKSILWNKPNVGSFSGGSSSHEAFFDTLLKAKRRGLAGTESIAIKYFKRNFTNVSLDRFYQSLHTPRYLGGLGFSNQFNTAISFATKATKTFSFTISTRSKLSLSPQLSDFAIKQRLKDAVPLPGIKTAVHFEKVKLVPNASTNVYSPATLIPSIPTDWNISHFDRESDVYAKRINLQYKIAKGLELYSSDIPTNVFDNSTFSPGTAFLKFRRHSRFLLNLEDADTTAEPFSKISSYYNKVWKGICYLSSIRSSIVKSIGFEKCLFLSTVHSRMQSHLPKVIVKV